MASLHDVAKQAGLNDKTVKQVFDAIVEICKRGENVRVHGFGSFKRVKRKGRTVKSPLMFKGACQYDDWDDIKFKSSNEISKRLSGE